LILTPNPSPNPTPTENVNNMPSESSFADRDFHVFNTCGKQELVVSEAASNPKKLTILLMLL
jgi:hypothetical protein